MNRQPRPIRPIDGLAALLSCALALAARPVLAATTPLPPPPLTDRGAAVKVVTGLVNDPFFPAAYHGATLLGPRVGDVETYHRLVYIYTLKRRADAPPTAEGEAGAVYLSSGTGGVITLYVKTRSEDCATAEIPSWPKLVPQWDAFARRHWPGIRRLSNWQADMSRYAAGDGTFTLQYGYTVHEAEIFMVALDIRLCDGRVGSVAVQDMRGRLGPKAKIPPAPRRADLIAAVLRGLRRA